MVTAVHKTFIVYCSLFIVICLLLIAPITVSAQSLSGVAANLELADSAAGEGDILTVSADGLRRTKGAYEATMYGVVVVAPILSVEPRTDKTKAVLTSGTTKVKVAADDEIKPGDFITSSDKEGVGRKATKSGYILGKAMEGYSDKSKTGLITVEVAIGYADIGGGANATGNIGNTFGKLLASGNNFQSFLRFGLAALIGLVTFVGVTYAFVRFVATGLVALGRNPMAKKTILGGMVISSLVIVAVAASGVGVALAIINLKLPFLGGK